MARLLTLLFLALILGPQWAPAAKDTWTGVVRIVAIGDIHGDYGQFFTLLRQTDLVDKKGKWTGGKTHLVQVGDVPDRGPDTRKIMDFLMRLEKQARKAGGYVHALIGNHEAMNVYGDLRYVTPEEYAAFRDKDSKRRRDAYWEQYAEQQRGRKNADGTEVVVDEAMKKEWYDHHPLGYIEHRLAWGPKGKYGQWVRRHNTIIKVNDTLFLHAGISARLASATLASINDEIRKELADFSLLKEGLAIASDGPLWYRGLAQGNETELMPQVDAALENFRVKRIVVGHTVTVGTVMPRFGGKVILIDAGMSAVYGGRQACLVIADGKPYTMHRGTRLELPDGTRAGLIGYLKAAAALDPPPSPLLAAIKSLETPSASAGQ